MGAGLLRPALVDAALALLLVETLWLLRRAGRGVGGGRRFVWTFAAAGAGLLLALRSVLAGWPPWVALAALAAAGVGNLLHVASPRPAPASARPRA